MTLTITRFFSIKLIFFLTIYTQFSFGLERDDHGIYHPKSTRVIINKILFSKNREKVLFGQYSSKIREEIFKENNKAALVYLSYQNRNLVKQDQELCEKLALLTKINKSFKDNPYKLTIALLFSKLDCPEEPAPANLHSLLANSFINWKSPIPTKIQVILNVNSLDLYRANKHQGAVSEQGVIDAFKRLHELSEGSADALYYTQYFARATDLQTLWRDKIPTLFAEVFHSFSKSMTDLLERSYNFAKLEHLCDPEFVTRVEERAHILNLIEKSKAQINARKNPS